MTGRAWTDCFESEQPKRSRGGQGGGRKREKIWLVGEKEEERKARLRFRYMVGIREGLALTPCHRVNAFGVNESH